MRRSAEEMEAVLKERGYTLTPQRRAIVRVLAERGGHWTAAELLQELTGEFPMASRATVYSTLALLRELGVVAAVAGAAGEVRFDGDAEAHHHFLCTSCGSLEDVPLDWFPVGIASEASPPFSVDAFRVVAEGCCDRCR